MITTTTAISSNVRPARELFELPFNQAAVAYVPEEEFVLFVPVDCLNPRTL
jgi:hypothetical protein